MTDPEEPIERSTPGNPMQLTAPSVIRDRLKSLGITVALGTLQSARVPINAVRQLLAKITELTTKNENQRHRIDDLEDQLDTDGMTGLLSGRALVRELAAMLERRHNRSDAASKRVSTTDLPKAVLVYLDVDNFKAFNDEYSDRAGDRALRHIAKLLRGTYDRNDTTVPEDKKLLRLESDENKAGLLRDKDTIGRQHKQGDEFAIIMYDTNIEDAEQIMQRVQRETAKTPFTYRQERITDKTGKMVRKPGTHSLNVSFTYGITDIRGTDTIATLKERASVAMKENKPKGGDEWVKYKGILSIAPPPPEGGHADGVRKRRGGREAEDDQGRRSP